MFRFIWLLLTFACATPVLAQTPKDFIDLRAAEAAAADSSFSGFDARRGKSIFTTRHGDWACTSCHTENPAAVGKHAVTEKTIQPLAPAANPERFTSTKKVDKWFRRNCHDVLKRACSAQEKGDVLTYLLSVGS